MLNKGSKYTVISKCINLFNLQNSFQLNFTLKCKAITIIIYAW